MSQIGRTLGSGRGRASAPPVDGAWARDGGGLGYLAAFSFWQLHSKNATPCGVVIDSEASAMHGDNLPRDRKTQPGSVHAMASGSLKPIEDSFVVLV